MEIRVKFVGGPRDKKSRSHKGKLPDVIRCDDDCKFHKVRGHYRREPILGGLTDKVQYHWVQE